MKKEVCPLKRNKIRICFGAVLTAILLTLGGCTCRASVKPVATAMPTNTATMAPVATQLATAIVTVVPAPSETPMASEAVNPSTSPMASEGTGGGTP